jgi:choline dehydrogenase-like flavoprotein
VLALPDDVQRRERLLGATVQLRPAGGGEDCELLVRAEQAPNPLSRVLLDDDPDPFGRRRARLDWLTLEQDWRSVVATASLVADALAQESGAEIRLAITEDEPWPWPPAHPAASATPTWGNHHMGTTRMDGDPARGVVDADCRVHGIENLFVAGSSVLPTGGYANPTFTIVALAIRLAERLRSQLWPATARTRRSTSSAPRTRETS